MLRDKEQLGSQQGKFTLEFILLLALICTLSPIIAQADVYSSLRGVQSKLTGVILPTLSVIGIAFAGLSFITGHENAKRHIIYAIIGTAIGFGAQSISDLISQTVR